MGLDQYAFARKGEEIIDISTWRKHANLEGWMANLYHKRGGEGDFNCTELRLFKNDLVDLEEAHADLEVAEGFFWGASTLKDIEDTQSFINHAKGLLAEGYEIIYSSWW
jgi:hypothetical protein